MREMEMWMEKGRQHQAIELPRLTVKAEPRNRLALGCYCQRAVNPDKHNRRRKRLRQSRDPK